MNAVGIDVSKGRSTVAILRPMGEVIQTPVDVMHDAVSLERLAYQILDLGEDTRVVMEAQDDTMSQLPENYIATGYSFPSSIPSLSTGIAQAVQFVRSRMTKRMPWKLRALHLTAGQNCANILLWTL